MTVETGTNGLTLTLKLKIVKARKYTLCDFYNSVLKR